jgi:hypothetical protein
MPIGSSLPGNRCGMGSSCWPSRPGGRGLPESLIAALWGGDRRIAHAEENDTHGLLWGWVFRRGVWLQVAPDWLLAAFKSSGS